MSCYEWEHGSLTLPSTSVAAIRKALREYANRLHALVYAEAIRLHRLIGRGTRSRDVYAKRLTEWEHSVLYAGRAPHHQEQNHVLNIAHDVLRVMCDQATPRPYRKEIVAIHQPTHADVDHLAPRATNRTTWFPAAGSEASITLEGRVLTWDVPENNHAVDSARSTPLAQVMFGQLLPRVRWTRASGGVLVGNNEYARDSTAVGGGGNYVTERFGPLGERDASLRALSRF